MLTLTASSTAALGTYVITICGASGPVLPGSVAPSTTFALTVSPVPSFSLDASSASPTIVQGGSGTSLITVTDLYGFAGNVQLSAANLPSGITASFTPNPTTGTSTLTLTASGTARPWSGDSDYYWNLRRTDRECLPFPDSQSLGGHGAGPDEFWNCEHRTTSPAIPLTFTVVNGGTLGSTAVLTQGATGLDFADAGTDTCAPNTIYTAGQTCTVNVTFTPRFAGTRNGASCSMTPMEMCLPPATYRVRA